MEKFGKLRGLKSRFNYKLRRNFSLWGNGRGSSTLPKGDSHWLDVFVCGSDGFFFLFYWGAVKGLTQDGRAQTILRWGVHWGHSLRMRQDGTLG